MSFAAAWNDPARDATNTSWARTGYADITSFLAGGYVNFMNPEEADRTEDSYGRSKYGRLQHIKRQYDPSNFFRLNPNIPPSSEGGGFVS